MFLSERVPQVMQRCCQEYRTYPIKFDILESLILYIVSFIYGILPSVSFRLVVAFASDAQNISKQTNLAQSKRLLLSGLRWNNYLSSFRHSFTGWTESSSLGSQMKWGGESFQFPSKTSIILVSKQRWSFRCKWLLLSPSSAFTAGRGYVWTNINGMEISHVYGVTESPRWSIKCKAICPSLAQIISLRDFYLVWDIFQLLNHSFTSSLLVHVRYRGLERKKQSITSQSHSGRGVLEVPFASIFLGANVSSCRFYRPV